MTIRKVHTHETCGIIAEEPVTRYSDVSGLCPGIYYVGRQTSLDRTPIFGRIDSDCNRFEIKGGSMRQILSPFQLMSADSQGITAKLLCHQFNFRDTH